MKYDLGLMELNLALEKLRHFYDRHIFSFDFFLILGEPYLMFKKVFFSFVFIL